MSKVLRTVAKVAIVVAAVASVAVTMGASLPAVIGTLSIASAASAVALVAGTIGSLTAKKPKAQGTTNQYSIDPQAGIPYPIGRTYFGGRLVHVEGYGGTENPYRSSVIIFGGGGPHQSIDTVLIDRSPVTFSGGAATGYYSGFMWFTSQLGATPEASALAAPFAGFPNWSAAHKLSGYAAGVWTVKFDPKGKVYASGTPEFGVVGKWAKVYDPRLDSTFPGGSGSCRALVESTYVWSENGALQGLTWALGRWQNGKRALGVGIPVADIDVQSFVDAANNADANSWKCGAVIDASGDKWNNLRVILQSAGAEPIDLGGLLSCRFDSAKVSLTTIGSDDLADGEIRVPAMKTWRDRINGVIPRYRSEAHNWEIIPASAVRGSTYETEDGEQRTREVEFYCVQAVAQAAQHAGYFIANSREIDAISLPLKTRFIGYKPGDCVTINLPEANLINQPVVITGRAIDPETGIISMLCRTETAAKHAWALGRTATPPPSATITAPADLDAIIWNNRTTLGQPTYRYPEAIPTDPVEGAIYIDANKRQYRFEGRALTLDGDPVSFGGDPVAMSGWVDVQDAAISAVASSALQAQAAADAKSTVFNSASEPAATAVNDLWVNPATGEIRQYTGGWSAPVADLTSAAVPAIKGPTTITLTADYQGALVADQLPMTLNFTRTRGGVDVSSSTAWSIVKVTGLQSGSAAITISSTGVVTLPSGLLIGPTASFTVHADRDDTELEIDVQVIKATAGVPATGSSAGTIVQDTSFNSVLGATMVGISDIMKVRTGAAGSIQLSASLAAYAAAASPAGIFGAAIIWRWRAIGGSFADVGTEVASDPDVVVVNEGPAYFREDGAVAAFPSLTGLTANTDYEVQLFARRTAASPAKTISFAGVASASGQ